MNKENLIVRPTGRTHGQTLLKTDYLGWRHTNWFKHEDNIILFYKVFSYKLTKMNIDIITVGRL